MIFRCAVLMMAAGLLSGCQTTAPESKAAASLQEALNSAPAKSDSTRLGSLPASVMQALDAQPASTDDGSLFGAERFDIQAQDVDAVAFFTSLVQDTEFSVAIHPEVSGSISLNLKQVPLHEVFEVVSDLYGFDIQRKGMVFRIYPAGMRTETFAVNYLLMKRIGATQTSINSGGVSQAAGQNGTSNSGGQGNFSGNNLGGANPLGGNNTNANGTNIATSTDTDFWGNLKETMQSLVGNENGRAVVVSPQAGLVTVRALPEEIKMVRQYLQTSEEHVKRQVVLEARIIEVSLSDDYQQGINWTEVLSHSGDTDFKFSTTGSIAGNGISAALGGMTSLSFVNKDFSGVISLLSTQGNVQVLSSPRVTATNNQKAVIKVGDDEYFVTDVSNQSTITAGATSSAPNIELTPFFSGIALDVTPQIDSEGSVLLHVHPSVIETQEQEKIVTLNEEQFVLPLAQSNIRESDTVIRANSGEIVVIGGLMQSVIKNSDSKTPLLGDIPILGNLFKSKRDVEQKKELIILLKPTVVAEGTWKEQLRRSSEQMTEWLYAN